MGDLMYTIQDFGVFKAIASGLVVFLFIIAFTHGGKKGGGSSGGGGGTSAPPPAAPTPPPAPPASPAQ